MRVQKNIPQNLSIDHYRLTQMFLNLVGNAIKFTDRGTVDISVEWKNDVAAINEEHFNPHPFDDEDELSEGLFQKNQRMSIFDKDSMVLSTLNNKIDCPVMRSTSNCNLGMLKITVTDSGRGIATKHIETLFEKFNQINSDISRRRLGTGLGLFITRQVCEKMEGKIRVFSKEGDGSCFMVCILVQVVLDNVAAIPEVILQKEHSIPQGLKALVVDDESFSLHILQNFLSHLNIEVLDSAVNGLLGYNKYVDWITRRNAPHIITLDLEMPVLDGKKTAEMIRDYEDKEKLEACLLIVVSGNCSESEISECLDVKGKIRANAFVKKPASLDRLSQSISHHFRQKITYHT